MFRLISLKKNILFFKYFLNPYHSSKIFIELCYFREKKKKFVLLGARHLGTRSQVNPTEGGNQRKLPLPVLTFCLDLKSYKNNMRLVISICNAVHDRLLL